MKSNVVLFVLLISCSTKQEEKVNTDGKDPDANWLTIYNADSARIDFKNGNRRILSYGLGMMIISEEANDSLCKAYNFVHFQAADCEVTNAFVKGANEYNDEMIKLLEKVNGKNWYKKYGNVIDSLAKIEREKDREYEKSYLMKRDSIGYLKMVRVRDSMENITKKELKKGK